MKIKMTKQLMNYKLNRLYSIEDEIEKCIDGIDYVNDRLVELKVKVGGEANLEDLDDSISYKVDDKLTIRCPPIFVKKFYESLIDNNQKRIDYLKEEYSQICELLGIEE